ncbi:MAGIX protein, partial [Molothrus ater]|nr:MAGIX protein [Molothrus ater]
PPPGRSRAPAWGEPRGQRESGERGEERGERGELLVLLRSLGPGAPPEPVAATSFVGPEPRDLLPNAPELSSPSSAGGGPGHGLGWAQHSPPFAVELPRGPGGFGFSLRGGPAGVFVRGLREGGPAQRCGCIQVREWGLCGAGGSNSGTAPSPQTLPRLGGGGVWGGSLPRPLGSDAPSLSLSPPGSPPAPAARGVLRLCVGSSPRGEPCFCLVGGLHP